MGQSVAPPTESCSRCRHYLGDKLVEIGPDIEANHIHVCSAFPDGEGIPWEILVGTRPHRSPYPGDWGILFEPTTF